MGLTVSEHSVVEMWLGDVTVLFRDAEGVSQECILVETCAFRDLRKKYKLAVKLCKFKDGFDNILRDYEPSTETLSNITLPGTPSRPRHHVVYLAAEMAPLAKVGDLGDVVTGLGCALKKKGYKVELIIPKYKTLDLTHAKNFEKLECLLYSEYDGVVHKNVVWTGVVKGLRVYFIHPKHPAGFFNRDGIYCEPDDFQRLAYFSRASLEFLLQFGMQPDIIHFHDWTVAAVAPMFKSLYAEMGLKAKIVLTCLKF